MRISNENIDYQIMIDILNRYGFILEDEYSRSGDEINLLKFNHTREYYIKASIYFNYKTGVVTSYFISTKSLSSRLDKIMEDIKEGVESEINIFIREKNIDDIIES